MKSHTCIGWLVLKLIISGTWLTWEWHDLALTHTISWNTNIPTSWRTISWNNSSGKDWKPMRGSEMWDFKSLNKINCFQTFILIHLLYSTIIVTVSEELHDNGKSQLMMETGVTSSLWECRQLTELLLLTLSTVDSALVLVTLLHSRPVTTADRFS